MLFSTLRSRNFALLWLAQIFATMGTEFFSVAAIIVVFQQSGSVLQTSAVMVARMMPSLVFSPVAGALVDRYTRRTVLVTVNIFRAILIILLLFLPQELITQNWVGYLIVALLAFADIFYTPSQQAFVPALVQQRELVQANGILLSATQLTTALSRAAAPLVIIFGSMSANILAASSYVIATLLTISIRNSDLASLINSAKPDQHISHLLDEIRVGWRYLRDNTIANTLVTMEYLEFWPHGIWSSALMLAFTQQALQAGTDVWGYQSSIFFFGQLIGSALALMLTPWIERYSGWIIIVNAALNSFLTFAFATTTSIPFAVLLCFAFGPPSAMRDVAQDALLQANVAHNMLGRIYATRKMLTDGAFLLAAISFGIMADFAPARWVYLIGAALYLITAAYALQQRSLRTATMTA